jgi:hypothetical protein
MFRTTIIRNVRLFSTNARLQKSATETIKDAAKVVDRTISDAAVSGIEKGGMYLPSFSFYLLFPYSYLPPTAPPPYSL